MTNTITYSMGNAPAIRLLPQPTLKEQEARRQAVKRRRWDTALEAITTLGLAACMVLLAVAILWVV